MIRIEALFEAVYRLGDHTISDHRVIGKTEAKDGSRENEFGFHSTPCPWSGFWLRSLLFLWGRFERKQWKGWSGNRKVGFTVF